MIAPLLRCRVCCWRSRDVGAARAHAREPESQFGPHRPYQPETATQPARTWAEIQATPEVARAS